MHMNAYRAFFTGENRKCFLEFYTRKEKRERDKKASAGGRKRF
jgi:hypothetical protein